jgi:hypothetical protein
MRLLAILVPLAHVAWSEASAGGTTSYGSNYGGLSWQQQQQQQQLYVGAEPQELPPLPAGWSEHMDPASGQPYYFNAADGTTTWDRPMQEATEETRNEDNISAEDSPLTSDLDDSRTESHHNDGMSEQHEQQPSSEATTDDPANAFSDDARLAAPAEEQRRRETQGWDASETEATHREPELEQQQQPWGLRDSSSQPVVRDQPGWGIKEKFARDEASFGAVGTDQHNLQAMRRPQQILQDTRSLDQGSSMPRQPEGRPLDHLHGSGSQHQEQRQQQQHVGRPMVQDPTSRPHPEKAEKEPDRNEPEVASQWESRPVVQFQQQKGPEHEAPHRFAQQQQHQHNALNNMAHDRAGIPREQQFQRQTLPGRNELPPRRFETPPQQNPPRQSAPEQRRSAEPVRQWDGTIPVVSKSHRLRNKRIVDNMDSSTLHKDSSSHMGSMDSNSRASTINHHKEMLGASWWSLRIRLRLLRCERPSGRRGRVFWVLGTEPKKW